MIAVIFSLELLWAELYMEIKKMQQPVNTFGLFSLKSCHLLQTFF